MFECHLYNGGDEDYGVKWCFLDGSGEVQEGLNLFEVSHYFSMPGEHSVEVEVRNQNGVLVGTDSKAVWVLWVNLEVVNSGSCPTEDSDMRDVYKACTRPNPPGRYDLGLGLFRQQRYGWGLAVHGDVTPECWDQPLSLTQWVRGRTYRGANGDQLRDDVDEDDTMEALLDNVAPHLYQHDYPGVRYHIELQDELHRIRANFTSIVRWEGMPCSFELAWCTAQSWHHVGPSEHDWATFSDPNVNPQPGDNICLEFQHLSSITWDMY